jgi:hypothetical protein
MMLGWMQGRFVLTNGLNLPAQVHALYRLPLLFSVFTLLVITHPTACYVAILH